MSIIEEYLNNSEAICEFVASIMPELKVTYGTYTDTSHLSPDSSPKKHVWLEAEDTVNGTKVIIDPAAKYIGNNGTLKNYKANTVSSPIALANAFVLGLDYSFVAPEIREVWERAKLKGAGLIDDGEWFKFKFIHRVYITETVTTLWSNNLDNVVEVITRLIRQLNSREKLIIDIASNENKDDLSYVLVNIIRKLLYDGVITKENFSDYITIIGNPIELNLRSLAFEDV